jgi:hypothetical protein
VADGPESITAAAFIDVPQDADLQALYAYWQRKRGARLLPGRADIDPAGFRKQLPHVMLHNVEGLGGAYTIRLVGGAIVQFVGKNFTGKPAGSEMQPAAATAMTQLLDLVVTSRAPKFRIGRAYWWREKNYRAYEAAFMPLAADGETVDMIFAGVKFDVRLGGGPY